MELVESIETYTDSQLSEMRSQADALQQTCQRLEEKLKQLEEPAPLPEKESATRVVPILPPSFHSHHRDHDRIIDLHFTFAPAAEKTAYK